MATRRSVAGLCMVTFREAVLGFEVERDYRADEGQMLCDLVYIEDKYVYVFTTDPIRPGMYRLAGEYFGLGKGDFAISLIDEHKGKDTRYYSEAARKYVIIPFIVQGKDLEIYACLSRVQLPWKRIEEICKDPSKRCFKIGDSSGGLCWVPNCIERNLASFSGINDPRIANPGNSIVVVGLFDHWQEAQRRAEKFRGKLDLYLQRRFDCNELGISTEQQHRLQMKKYAAGLVFNLINSTHPQAARYKAAFKNGGRDIESFIRDENHKEVAACQEAEKAAYFLARWINDADGIFEQMLCDYTTTTNNQDHWDLVMEFYCELLNRFNEVSIMRKYLHDKWNNRESWLKRYLLNENAFQGHRKVTNAVTQFLTVMSEIAFRNVDIQATCKTVHGIYKIWFRDIVFEVFSNKLKKSEKYYLTSLLKTPQLDMMQQIRISEQCEPLEKLGKVVDSKAVQGVLVAIEAVNMGIAVAGWHEENKKLGVIGFESSSNLIGSILDLLTGIGDVSKKVGKTPLAAAGTFSAVIDSGLAFYDSYSEFRDKDYDAMISKIVAGSGAASIAVGSSMVTAAALSAAIASCEGASLVAIVQTLWGFGAGATASGIGAPVGGALIFLGSAIFAAGTIAYFFSNDSATEQWVKECEWGQKSSWNFLTTDTLIDHLNVLHGLLYSFKAEPWFDIWNDRAGIRIRSQFFQAETKIIIQKMVLKNENQHEDIVSLPLIIEENRGERKIAIEIKQGPEIEITASFHHKTNLKDRDQIEAEIFVDLFGNGKVLLPERKMPLISKAVIF